MPTRKQRRRREKSLRHDWEYVYVDDDGNEVEVDPAEAKPAKPSQNGRTGQRRQRADARIQPPSWKRVGKRGLIFAPLMFVTVMFTNADASVVQQLALTVWLLVIFLPFSYFMDSLFYRRYLKRTGQEPAKR